MTKQTARESRSRIKTAFVSGGSKGIGLAVVRALIAENYFVITCGRSRITWAEAMASDQSLQNAVDFQQCDLSQDGAIDALFAYIAENYACLDVAVNNASPEVASGGVFQQAASEALLCTLLSDLWVPAQCLQQELKLMQRGGAIVNISSVNGIRPTPGAAMYGAAKHGLEGLTRSVALEAIDHGIRVNAVAPGVTWTPRWEKRVADGKAIRTDIERVVPIKRFAAVEEIAAAVLWLASGAASYVVGHTIVVDGGLSLR